MKLVIDTNIVFSAILNIESNIGKLIFSNSKIKLYSSVQLQEEILEHRSKILKISKYSEDQFQALILLIFSKITFIDDELIDLAFIKKAEKLLINIDPDDIIFLALAFHLKAKLWTGDKKLISGLKAEQLKNIVVTSELIKYS